MLPAETTEITLGEVARKVDLVAANVKELTQSVAANPNWRDMQSLKESADSRLLEMAEDIKELKAWQTWALRLVVGFVVAGILGAILVFKP